VPVFTAHEVQTQRESSGPRRARASFFLILIAWDAYLLVGFAYTLWMRHHPHIQSATNNVVLSVELDLFIVGNLVIVATGMIVRQIARRRQRSDVAS
jgi:hypothetical protein